MTFIDVHVHVYRADCPPADGFSNTQFATLEQVLKQYDELSIENGLLLPLTNPESCLPQSNEEILDFCEQSGGRLFPFCNVDPRAMRNYPDAPLNIWLEHYRNRGCKGIGEVCANLAFLDDRVQNLFKHAQNVGLPLTFHLAPAIGKCYGLYDDAGLPQLQQSLARFPDLKFLGHSQGFWAEIVKLDKPGDRFTVTQYPVKEEGVVPKLLREYPNLYGDLSASGYYALVRDKDYAAKFLTEFQDKIMFGTDICYPNYPSANLLVELLIDMRDSGKISETVFNKVARENTIKVFDLETD